MEFFTCNLADVIKQFSRISQPICTFVFNPWEFLLLHLFSFVLFFSMKSQWHRCWKFTKPFGQQGEWHLWTSSQVYPVASPVPGGGPRLLTKEVDLLEVPHSVSWLSNILPNHSVSWTGFLLPQHCTCHPCGWGQGLTHCWPSVISAKVGFVQILLVWLQAHLLCHFG